MKTGTPKFTAVAVATLNIDFTKPTMEVETQVALVNPTTGVTYAWSKMRRASDATKIAIQALRDALEQDAVNEYLMSTSDGVVTSSVASPTAAHGLPVPPPEPSSLLDHLQGTSGEGEAETI